MIVQLKNSGAFRFNPHKLLNREKIWLMTNYCRHGHTYMEHPKCYYNELPSTSPIKERIGFLDIESTNLRATFGYVISWAIKERGGQLIHDCVTKEEIQAEANTSLGSAIKIDHRILQSFYNITKDFDRLVVYWGRNRRHDIPYLRHRCLKAGVDFPIYKEVILLDVYDWVRNFLSMHSNRLEKVCEEFEIPAKKHKLTGNIWIKAGTGNKKALAHILDHNDEDVLCLEPLYNVLEPFARQQKASI